MQTASPYSLIANNSKTISICGLAVDGPKYSQFAWKKVYIFPVTVLFCY